MDCGAAARARKSNGQQGSKDMNGALPGQPLEDRGSHRGAGMCMVRGASFRAKYAVIGLARKIHWRRALCSRKFAERERSAEFGRGSQAPAPPICCCFLRFRARLHPRTTKDNSLVGKTTRRKLQTMENDISPTPGKYGINPFGKEPASCRAKQLASM